MENFENEEFRQEHIDTQPQQPEQPEPHQTEYRQPYQPPHQPSQYGQQTYHQPDYQQTGYQQYYRGAGVGRKESPFADSPYMMNHERQNSRQYQNSYVPPVPPEQPPVKPPKAKKKKNPGAWKRVLACVLAVVLVAGSCGITAFLVNRNWEARSQQMMAEFDSKLNSVQAQLDEARNSAQSYPEYVQVDPTVVITAPGAVYSQNVDSVVLVTAEVVSSMYGQTATGYATGSGFILSEDGYVVTNHHVVDDATKVTITTHAGIEYTCSVVGSDATNDVALLKADTTDQLPAVVIGSSDELNVGDQVVAIGNPLGELTSTLTVGYVSAKERDVTTDGVTINMIQTDAAINSGNSGGPLFNMNGEVVGITTAKYSGSSSSGASIEGIGFAIPIDDVMPLVEDLKTFGYVTGAYLGVMVSDMDADTASYYGLPVGAYIQEVTPGYCAEEAGLKAKDIITGLGAYEIGSVTDLTRALRNFDADDTTQITVFRSGQKLTFSITLDEKPQETVQEDIPAESGKMPDNGSYDEWYRYFAPFFGNGG